MVFGEIDPQDEKDHTNPTQKSQREHLPRFPWPQSAKKSTDWTPSEPIFGPDRQPGSFSRVAGNSRRTRFLIPSRVHMTRAEACGISLHLLLQAYDLAGDA